MTYSAYDSTKPDGAAQNGAQAMQSIRDNMNALRDAAILSGGFPGFNMTPSGGTADQPTQLLYSKGTERVKAVLTWGTSGGEADNVTHAVYSYSANSGSTWSVFGTKDIAWDSNGNVISTTWS